MTPDQPEIPLPVPEIPLRKWVLEYVEQNPGCSKIELRKGVEHKMDQALEATMELLLEEGDLVDRVDGRRASFYRPGEPGSGE